MESLIAAVAAIEKRIEAFAPVLTPADRLATLKMRPGGEPVVATLAQLAGANGVALPQADGMAASLTRAQRVRPLAEAARQLTRRLDDCVLQAQGDCWWSATALYTTLSRIASASPQLAAALQPVVSFFAVGPRKKTPPLPPPPPVTPPPAQAPSPAPADLS